MSLRNSVNWSSQPWWRLMVRLLELPKAKALKTQTCWQGVCALLWIPRESTLLPSFGNSSTSACVLESDRKPGSRGVCSCCGKKGIWKTIHTHKMGKLFNKILSVWMTQHFEETGPNPLILNSVSEWVNEPLTLWVLWQTWPKRHCVMGTSC